MSSGLHARCGRHVTQPSTAGSETASAWSANDKATLQRVIDPMKSGFRFQPFGFLRAEATTMLCAPSSEVYERLTSMLTTMSVVSGLLLSSIAGVALEPLDVETYPAEKQLQAEVYNIVAAVVVATQTCVTLYSTFTLYITISAAHDPPAVYRTLLHMVRWIGLFEFMTFIPPMLTIVLVCLAAHLNCKWAFSKWLVTALCAALVAGFQGTFAHVMSYALPYNSWAWASVAGLGLGQPWSTRLRTTAKAHAELLLTQAKEGVLAGLDDNDDGIIDDHPSTHTAADEAELAAWVRGALEQLTSTKRELLVEGLLTMGLTRERMVEAARHPGGFQALCDVIANHPGGLGLRPGERLALASAAMRAHETVHRQTDLEVYAPNNTASTRVRVRERVRAKSADELAPAVTAASCM